MIRIKDMLAASPCAAVVTTAASMDASSGGVMTRYHQGRVKVHRKPRAEASARLIAFLRRLYPNKTAEAVAFDTGISVNTIASWLKGTAVPNGVALITLIDTYEVDFLAAVMPHKAGWLAEAERSAELRRIKAERAVLDARAEALGSC